MSLCRKSLGSQEMGSLKNSLDVVRGEVESMAKQHQGIAAQMKSELEEPLAAFAGGMKERRKIVQNGIEKLLKVKIQQTQMVNKVSFAVLGAQSMKSPSDHAQTRDRYEQECLKIKGYLAQGHMVMGQEERKNKAKLEKTQISVATSNTDYETAVKALEETTVRWNREWKAAADKFQDLEEERLDFTKSSLWTFANVASTVCVSDDAACEKIRLSLEKLEVEKDIVTFIKERGTGQEIPDPPKYINFCRGDVDSQSEASEDESYSVAQFPRSINPAFRSSSPQPSTYDSHHDPTSALARDLGHGDPSTPPSREQTMTPQKIAVPLSERHRGAPPDGYHQPKSQGGPQYDPNEFAPVPHDPYPMDGMTMLCRTRPQSELGSQVSSNVSARPSSRDSHSDYSNPTSVSSVEPPTAKMPIQKPEPMAAAPPEHKIKQKKSGFFQNHSPFRRKSTKDVSGGNTNRNTWHPTNAQKNASRSNLLGEDANAMFRDRTASPDPIDSNATLALNVGQNVFPVSTPDRDRRAPTKSREPPPQDDDPIAMALAELKGVTLGKQSSVRVSADHYHGIATPAPGAQRGNGAVAAAMRGTPPPSYDQQVQRLGVPPQAVTSKAMKQASQKYQEQTRSMFSPSAGGGSYGSRPSTRGHDMPRATSPAPPRSASPRPGMDPRKNHRSASPNPYSGSSPAHHHQQYQQQQPKRGSDQGYYRHHSPASRAASPSPYRPGSSMGEMAVQLAPVSDDGRGGGSMRGRDARGIAMYDGRQRSKSVVDPNRAVTRDGRAVMHFGKFAKLVHQTYEYVTDSHRQLVRFTCIKLLSPRSSASTKETCSLYCATRTTVGGRPRSTVVTATSV
jgi:hypothetical protein